VPFGRYARSRQLTSDPYATRPGASVRMARRVVPAFTDDSAIERARAAAARPALRPRGAKRYRLTGTGAFAAIFRDGIRSEGDFVQLIAVPARRVPGRAGFVVGRKAFALAIERNRARRVLRAVVAAARPEIERFDVIVRLKRGCAPDEMRSVAAEAQRLIATLTGRAAAGAAR